MVDLKTPVNERQQLGYTNNNVAPKKRGGKSLCVCIHYCPRGNFSHGKLLSLSPREVSCDRVAIPSLN